MYNEEYSIGCQMSKNAQEIYEISSTSTESAPTLVSDSCLTCATLRNSCYVMERRCCRFRFQKFVYRPERLDTWHALHVLCLHRELISGFNHTLLQFFYGNAKFLGTSFDTVITLLYGFIYLKGFSLCYAL